MPQVQTVRGPVDATDLGQVLVHEHVFVLDPEIAANHPGEWGDEDARVDDAVARLTDLTTRGVRTIVDPTVIGLGRDVPRVQRVAERVPGLHVVVATGLYTYDRLPPHFRYRGPRSGPGREDPLLAMFVADIEEGIAGTGVRAGLLKCAIDEPGLTPDVERVLRAVARAHLRTGVPVTVHTHPGTRTGLTVDAVFAQEGVDPRSVVLGHSGDSLDLDHLCDLAERGYLLGMDRFGIERVVTSEQRADVVVEMCRRGHAGSMVLSQDASCYIDWMPPRVREAMPRWRYTHVHDDVLPYLRAHGVTEEQVTAMLVDNPRRYLEPRPR